MKNNNKIVFKKSICRALCDYPNLNEEVSSFNLEWFPLLLLLDIDMIDKDLNDKLTCLCHLNILKVVDV
jgi:hypothetical protein